MNKRMFCELSTAALLLAGELTHTGWPKCKFIVHDQSGMCLSGNDRIWEGKSDNVFRRKDQNMR